MEERRKIKRRYLTYYTRVFDAETHEQLGNLVDITPVGVMMVSDNPLPPNKIFMLRLELTEELVDKPFIDFKAKSVWCHADIDPQYFNTGFQIIEIEPQDVEIINRIVETYGFRDN